MAYVLTIGASATFLTGHAAAVGTVSTSTCANAALPQEILDGPPLMENPKPLHVTHMMTSSSILTLAIAGNATDKEAGLACVRALKPRSGEILVFQTTELQDFWDHDTVLPLDYIWLDERGQVTKISTDSHAAGRAVQGSGFAHRSGIGRYVVIVPAGTAFDTGIRVGSVLYDHDLYGNGVPQGTSDTSVEAPPLQVPIPVSSDTAMPATPLPTATAAVLVPFLTNPITESSAEPTQIRSLDDQSSDSSSQPIPIVQITGGSEIASPAPVVGATPNVMPSENIRSLETPVPDNASPTISPAVIPTSAPTPSPMPPTPSPVRTPTVPVVRPTESITTVPTVIPTVVPTIEPIIQPSPTVRPNPVPTRTVTPIEPTAQEVDGTPAAQATDQVPPKPSVTTASPYPNTQITTPSTPYPQSAPEGANPTPFPFMSDSNDQYDVLFENSASGTVKQIYPGKWQFGSKSSSVKDTPSEKDSDSKGSTKISQPRPKPTTAVDGHELLPVKNTFYVTVDK